MNWFTDSRGEMSGLIDDLLAEQLLSGTHYAGVEEPELSAFLRDLSTFRGSSTDPARMATVMAATAKGSGGPPVGVRRLGTAAAAGTLIVAIAGVAVAADGSAPGDPLYNLDRAVEWLGLDDGGVVERIAEVEVLVARDDLERANEVLDSIALTAVVDAATVQDHLDLALTKTSEQARQAQADTAEKKAFIEENKGSGNGLDAEEFGEGVSEIARAGNETQSGHETPTSVPASESEPSEDKKDPPGQLKKEAPVSAPEGPIGGGNPQGGEEGGPPDHAGPEDK